MSEVGPDVESEDADIKEFLIQKLRSDGALKQIQDKLTAIVYSAFYQHNSQSSPQLSSAMHSFMRSQNGIEVISFVVDLLRSLDLSNTLNVLTYEATLKDYQLKKREELASNYQINGQTDSQPLISLLIAPKSNDVPYLSKAIVLESDEKNLDHDSEAVEKANGHNAAPIVQVESGSKQWLQSFPAADGAPPPYSEHNVALGDSRSRQQPKSPIEITKGTTRDFFKDNDTNSRRSQSSIRSVDEVPGTAAISSDETSDSIHERLNIGPPSEANSHSKTAKSSDYGSRKDVFRAVPGRARNALEPDANNLGNSSDIDSEVNNDITVNSSRFDECDYMEPIRK